MTSTVGLIPNWFPPNRENYDLIVSVWKWFPVAASLQWIIPWYGMGKTSVTSRLNLPGRVGWLLMEAPGFLTLLYHMRTLPSQAGVEDLPWQNKVLAGLFVIHYSYRAILYPFLQPSMSPLHILIFLAGLSFQLLNGLCIGAHLAAYGPVTAPPGRRPPSSPLASPCSTSASWPTTTTTTSCARSAARAAPARARAARDGGDAGSNANSKGVDKHYEMPQAGLFKVVLYPHYLVEWVEWFGFWMAAGWGCVPARCFLLNEVAAMLPRAVRGKRWYVEKFGEEAVGRRWAVIPGVW
ncbi:hypothetical protein NEMBOFW57_010031 [Staphylotrichum longicolle]|uniref:3-oxo-5-alpha-steroid 4-dehydrogenase C-terminal domain-containing protein n=1 Tax=Staphylotrichum longicolle TaxID=669026 RepID=A0AAD4EQ56_9PEZI|nr:hypothetical protein NEMBOFW57_010031 [Staphylotrichum longicolle]